MNIVSISQRRNCSYQMVITLRVQYPPFEVYRWFLVVTRSVVLVVGVVNAPVTDVIVKLRCHNKP